jgi:hypothetical protein
MKTLFTSLIILGASIVAVAQESAVPDTVVIRIQSSTGQIIKQQEIREGESFRFSGLTFPLQQLNGLELSLPDSAVQRRTEIIVELPDFAQVDMARQRVSFGDSMALAVRFRVEQEGEAISPFYFDNPIELTMPIPPNLPSGFGAQVSQFRLTYRTEDGRFDTTGIRTRVVDALRATIMAEVEHFSIIALTDGSSGTTTSIEQDPSDVRIFELEQNFPNPFNPSTVIRYAVVESGAVKLEVFNMLGQRVALLDEGVKVAGSYTATFEAGNLPSGVYTYRLTGNGISVSRNMMLVK